jgi:hypothetical protein
MLIAGIACYKCWLEVSTYPELSVTGHVNTISLVFLSLCENSEIVPKFVKI